MVRGASLTIAPRYPIPVEDPTSRIALLRSAFNSVLQIDLAAPVHKFLGLGFHARFAAMTAAYLEQRRSVAG